MFYTHDDDDDDGQCALATLQRMCLGTKLYLLFLHHAIFIRTMYTLFCVLFLLFACFLVLPIMPHCRSFNRKFLIFVLCRLCVACSYYFACAFAISTELVALSSTILHIIHIATRENKMLIVHFV